MKQLLLKILFIFTLLSLYHCSSNNDNDYQGFTPTLPAITQTGANTFGCYIDGKLLTPRDGAPDLYGPNKGMRRLALGTAPNYIYNEIYIDDRKSEKGGLLRIHTIELHRNGEGTYTINESNCQNGLDANTSININCRVYDAKAQIFKWYCSIENAGTLTISRYDYDNGILSGTFSCTMQNRDNPNEQIEISQGRFDINGYTLRDTEFP
jgi:hypothetical protein